MDKVHILMLLQQIDNFYNDLLSQKYLGSLNFINDTLEEAFLKFGDKSHFEILSYIKYQRGEFRESFYFGYFDFLNNKNSTGVVYAGLSLLNIDFLKGCEFLKTYKRCFKEALECNKCNKKNVFEVLKDYMYLDPNIYDICLQIKDSNNHLSKKYEEKLNNTNFYLKDIQNVVTNDFSDNFIKIRTYKGEGRVSMHLIKINDSYIILDCGMDLTFGGSYELEIEKFLRGIDRKKILGAIISHAHKDHYGSFKKIIKLGIKIYWSRQTFSLIELTNKEVDRCKCVILEENKPTKLKNIKVTLIPNGHILGSCFIVLEWNDKILLYTGDFFLEDQTTVKGVDKKLLKDIMERYNRIDYLISETTNGDKNEWLNFYNKKELIKYFVRKSTKLSTKVIICALSLGIAQEILSALNEEKRRYYITFDGLGYKITNYYDSNLTHINLLNPFISKMEEDESFEDILNKSEVIFVSSINFIKNIEKLKTQNMITLIICGNFNTYYRDKLKNSDGINYNIVNIDFNIHSHKSDLLKFIKNTKCKNLIMVHGNGIK